VLHLLDDRRDVHLFAFLELGIAEVAAEIAAGQADEDRRAAGIWTFALNRRPDGVDDQGLT
jgi:hypothetical protein